MFPSFFSPIEGWKTTSDLDPGVMDVAKRASEND